MKRNNSLTRDERAYLKELGSRLRDLREERGYSQKKLYILTGISQSTICYYEKGEMPVTVTNLKKICEALGADLGITIFCADKEA